jgi:glycosyltransferase involved in cell wall biosynthesis
MRSLLAKYQPSAGIATLTPWALSEPIAVLRPDCAERRQLFGTAALALLYSGNFGRAHSCGELLELMRQLRGKGFAKDIKLVFGVRGNREHVLNSAVTAADLNISFCEFASADALERRLSAADIHVVSLRPEWTGTVVPSKFFGAIASGRPVLFAGNQDSAVAQWIRSFHLGWVLTAANTSEVAASLVSYMSDQAQQDQMRQHCFQVYHHHFSRTQILNSFHHKLQMLLQEESSQVLHKKASQTEQ